MKKFIILLFLLSSLYSLAQSKMCWPNSRGNFEMTGYTLVDFPQDIKLEWTYDADGIFKSAPIVCDGKIVVGSTNGTLYCLNMQGDSIWGFKTNNAIEAPALINEGIVYFGNLTGSLFA